jgi:hypothetical protein
MDNTRLQKTSLTRITREKDNKKRMKEDQSQHENMALKVI